jgi:hypothetical protein
MGTVSPTAFPSFSTRRKKFCRKKSLGGQKRITSESNVELKNTGRGNTRQDQFERCKASSAFNSRFVRVRSDSSNLISVILMFRHKLLDAFENSLIETLY